MYTRSVVGLNNSRGSRRDRWTRFGLLLLVPGMLVVGCGRKVMPSTSTEIRDSVTIREVERRVEVPVPGDTVTFTEYIRCDSITNRPVPMRKQAAKGRARVHVDLDGTGKLSVSGVCDSLRLAVTVRDKIIQQLRTEKRTTTQVVYEHTPRWYDVAARWIAGIALVVLAICIARRLR